MKKIAMTLVIGFLISNVTLVQAKTSFGINGGLSFPAGEMNEIANGGLGFGTVFIIPTSIPITGLTFGANFFYLSGKTISRYSPYSDYYSSYEYEPVKVFSVFVGPQFGKEKGPYFVPAINGNIYDGRFRSGFDVGLGFIKPLASGRTKLNLCFKTSLLNLSKNDHEIRAYLVRILAGLNF